MAAGPAPLRDLLDALPPRVTYSDRLEAFAPERRDALMAWLLPENDDERRARLDHLEPEAARDVTSARAGKRLLIIL